MSGVTLMLSSWKQSRGWTRPELSCRQRGAPCSGMTWKLEQSSKEERESKMGTEVSVRAVEGERGIIFSLWSRPQEDKAVQGGTRGRGGENQGRR
jgi:hypothetical protein